MTEGDPTGDAITVPFTADAPDGWERVDPATVGVPDATLVLVDRRHEADFTPNITVAVGRRRPPVDIVDVADEAVGRLAAAVGRLSLVERVRIDGGIDQGTHHGAVDRTGAGDGPEAPGFTQLLRLQTPGGASDTWQDLVQSQVHLGVRLPDADVLLVELACTCAEDQGMQVMPDFQTFVASFAVRQEA